MVYFARLYEPLKLLRHASGPNGLRPIWQTSGNSAPWSASPPDNYCFTSAEENGRRWWFVPWTIRAASVSVGYSAKDLKHDLVSIDAETRPVAMGGAVGNLIDNGFNYTKAPMVVRLNAIRIPHQSRFGIKPAEFPEPDKNELYYDCNTLMKPAAPKSIAVFG